jgi:hypothetical protein
MNKKTIFAITKKRVLVESNVPYSLFVKFLFESIVGDVLGHHLFKISDFVLGQVMVAHLNVGV